MKKILSIFLTLMLFASFFPASISAAEGTVLIDVSGDEYYADSAQILAQLGILTGYEDNTFRAEKLVTRGEMAAIVCRILDETADKSNTVFSDVPSSHWSSGYIAIASQKGIISGDGDGSFRPEDNVKYEEAIKMVVCALGYGENVISEPSDWSGVYLSIAEESGISANLHGKKGEDSSRGDIAVMVFNGIESSEIFKDKLTSVASYNSWKSFTPANTHKVTFMMGDGSGRVHAVQYVKNGALSTVPEAPSRSFYSFAGWYTDDPFDFNTPITSDVTVYAKWEAAADDCDYISQAESETIFSVTNIEIKDGVVYTTINVNSQAVLVLSFCDENTGETLGILSENTPNYGELLSVGIPMNLSLPEHFIIAADLYNRNSQKLCETYTCIYYTSAYEKFDRQTVYDFDSGRVINFDDSEANNFGVLNDGVLRISCQESVNKLTVENTDSENGGSGTTKRTYTIENPSETVASLKSGDKVYVDSTDYLFKVDTVTTVGNRVVLTELADISICEFYDVLKVNMPSVASHYASVPRTELLSSNNRVSARAMPLATANTSSVSEAAAFSHSYSVDPYKTTIPSAYLDLTLDSAIDGEIEVSLAYDSAIFSDAYLYCEMSNKMKMRTGIDVKAKAGKSNDDALKRPTQKIELPKLSIYTGVPGMFAVIKPAVVYGIEISSSLHIEHVAEVKNGFIFSTNAEKPQIIEQKENLYMMDTENELSIKAGVSAGIGVEFLNGALSASINGEFGIGAEGKLSSEKTETIGTKHGCELCVTGYSKFYATVYADLDYKVTDKVKGTLLKMHIADFELPCAPSQFYVSVKNDEQSCFGGEIRFGYGECPNIMYRTIITVSDGYGNDVAANVSVTKRDLTYGETLTAPFKEYLYPGEYTIETMVDGEYIQKEFVLSNQPEIIQLKATNQPIPEEPEEKSETDDDFSNQAEETSDINSEFSNQTEVTVVHSCSCGYISVYSENGFNDDTAAFFASNHRSLSGSGRFTMPIKPGKFTVIHGSKERTVTVRSGEHVTVTAP